MIKYRAFIQVVESGSITKAAKALGYSQPGISYMIDCLEKEMGFPLLVRSKDNVKPTKDGERVLYHCKQIVNSEDDLMETVRAISGLMDGTVFIASQNSMLVNIVPLILARFNESFSGVTVNLSELPFHAFAEVLQSGDVDLGFMSEAKIKGFKFFPLFYDPLCVIMHKNHPFARYEKIPASVLNGCDFILPTKGWDDTVQMVQDEYPFQANIRYEVASDTAGIALTAQNQGVYIMSNLQTSMLPPEVTHREFEEDICRTMGYTVKTLKNATPALTEFVRITESTVKEIVESESNLLRPITEK